VLSESGLSLAELTKGMKKLPNVLINIPVTDTVDLSKNPKIQHVLHEVELTLRDNGRVLLRASGTEPVIRVMVEGSDAAQVQHLAQHLASVVKEQVAR